MSLEIPWVYFEKAPEAVQVASQERNTRCKVSAGPESLGPRNFPLAVYFRGTIVCKMTKICFLVCLIVVFSVKIPKIWSHGIL